MAAVAKVHTRLGQRSDSSVQCRPWSVESMPCQMRNGGFVFTMSGISDLSGSQWPLAAVARAICA